MGTMLYAQGRLHQQELRRAEPDAAGAGRRGAPGVRARRRRRHRDQHLRRQPDQARRRSAWPTGCTTINVAGRADRAARGARRRPTSPARSGRSASASSRGARPASTRRATTSASRRRRSPTAASICSSSRRSATSTRSARRSTRCAACRDLPIVAQMTTEEDGNTLDGTPPERFAPELEARGATIIGVNCASARRRCSRRSSGWPRSPRVRLSAQPNAGQPRDVEGRNIYLCSPEYMASYARRFIQHNVRLVGGCCGTTPEHIRQIKAAVRASAPAAAQTRRPTRRTPKASARRRRSASTYRRCRASKKSRLAQRAGPRHVRRRASSCCRRAAIRPNRSSSARGA